MAKQYLDYEGLRFYTEQMKAWVLAQISSAGAVTPADVDRKITAALERVASTFDDTKVYDSLSSFPVKGEKDIIYIAQDTGFQYVWNPLLDEGAGDYEVLAEPINPDDISHIVTT